MRILFFLLSFFILSPVVISQNLTVGQWKAHFPYVSCKAVVEGKDRLFVVSDQSLYTVEHYSGNIVEKLSKVEGLSDAGVKTVDYNASRNIVLVAYQNTNIDLIKGKEIINIPDILRKSILGLKEINSIRMHGDLAFLSCTFGLVVIDLVKYEVKESYTNIGAGGAQINIRATAIYNDSIYVATDNGLRRAHYSSAVNLNDFSKWSTFGSVGFTKHVISFGNSLYTDLDSVVQQYTNGSWVPVNTTTKINTVSMRIAQGKLVIAQADVNGKFIVIDNSGNKQIVPEKFMNDAVIDKNGHIWFGTTEYGIIRLDPAGIVNKISIQPNGPRGETSFSMLGFDDQMWVTSGGMAFNQGPLFNNYGFYWYKQGFWNNREPIPMIQDMRDFTAIARDPKTKRIYIGTHLNGMLEVDENGTPIRRYNETNSTLRRVDGQWTITSGVAVDEAGNVWVTNYNAGSDSGLHVLKPDGTWKGFKSFSNKVNKLIIDDFGQKWMISQGNQSNFGLVVYNDNGTIDDLSDDKTKPLNNEVGTGALPSSDVKAIAKDKDGSIWVGTSKGIAVIYSPGNVFTGENYDASQIQIGKGAAAGYLLGSEVVNDIVIDGANRKWVATNNGVWLVSADGTSILRHFDIENSPLFSNSVTCIGIIPKTGEVFFGTVRGIVSYRGDATEGEKVHKNVKVFPNPVKPEYRGQISITGLPTDASVKITDIAGNLVYETIANGGMATWDGRNFRGERPKTGVYLIFTASKDGADDYVSKLLFIN